MTIDLHLASLIYFHGVIQRPALLEYTNPNIKTVLSLPS